MEKRKDVVFMSRLFEEGNCEFCCQCKTNFCLEIAVAAGAGGGVGRYHDMIFP